MKTKLAFVVIQYNTYGETIDCINSLIQSFNKNEYEVVVVDNGSQNGAAKKVKENFRDMKSLHVILLNENSGYSKANNIGYRYAKEKFDPDFFYVINNDTLINQKDQLNIIEEEFSKSNFDILGPDIITPLGIHQQGIKELQTSRARIIRLLGEYVLRYLFASIYLHNLFEGLRDKVKKKVLKRGLEIDYSVPAEGILLHGAALIFSRKFSENMKVPFYPETFFYGDEEILNYNARKFGLTVIYNPQLKIIHKSNKTTNEFNNTKRRTALFRARNYMKALPVLLKYMNQNNQRPIK